MRIYTIGYEGTTVPEFITTLKGAGVERVIDVRAHCRGGLASRRLH